MLLSLCLMGSLAGLSLSASFEKAYIVGLSPASGSSFSLAGRALDPHESFHKRAKSLNYTIRHEFKNLGLYLGLSIQVSSAATDAETQAELHAIPGVVSVSNVYPVSVALPNLPTNITIMDSGPSSESSPKPPPALPPVHSAAGLQGALQMGGVDKLHAAGIKGKGIKIGVVDTGVDYNHPALGGGFGPGYKIAGGYSFVTDAGALANSSDPLTTCYGTRNYYVGGHGTHVAGILAMDSVPGSFDIVGVAPEATIYMYKALDCTGGGGSDTIMAAMQKAYEDGVDIISMSIGITQENAGWDGGDPLADITQSITNAGVAVVVAMSNDVAASPDGNDIYTERWPSELPAVIGVGAISNADFPLVYSATDSKGSTIQYASVYPLNIPNGADVYIITDPPCDQDPWTSAIAAIENINNTVIAFTIGADINCLALDMDIEWASAGATPLYIMALNSPTSDPYDSAYDVPSQGFFNGVEFLSVNATDAATINTNYAAVGGYKKYKLHFVNNQSVAVPQPSGGMIDYYSDYGPVDHTYLMKPQLAAPGGHILSTWPLGPLGGYVILSGTSMATPYAAASYALVKSQFPSATIAEILALLQTNASPVNWAYNTGILSATVQQGAGLINPYNAINSQTTITPGQLLISDVSRTVYGTANITITNKSTVSKTYTLSHLGAGYTAYYPQGQTQSAQYGTANFPTSTITLSPGKSQLIDFSITPPSGVIAVDLPVFGGFIKATSNAGETYTIPYAGPPYSLFNTPYIQISASAPVLPQIFIEADTGNIYDTGFLEINASQGYGSDMDTLQWSQEILIHLLPGDTTIKAVHYGLNTTTPPSYQPSAFAPGSNIFGYPSFGTLVAAEGSWQWPENYGVFPSDTLVTADNGTAYEVGNGDYRFFAAVLRQGGTSGQEGDYDTWLGPVIRFVGS